MRSLLSGYLVSFYVLRFSRDRTLSASSETHAMAALFTLMVMANCGQIGTACPSFFSMSGDAALMRTHIQIVL